MTMLVAVGLASALSPTPPPRYNCEAEYEYWETAWTPDWKSWCCEHAQKGCPSTTTNTSTTNTETSSTATSSTRTATATSIATSTTTEAEVLANASVMERRSRRDTCSESCKVKGFSANCRDRIRWASIHVTQEDPDPCKAAYDLVAAQCDMCSSCMVQDVFLFQDYEVPRTLLEDVGRGQPLSTSPWSSLLPLMSALLLSSLVLVLVAAASMVLYRSNSRRLLRQRWSPEIAEMEPCV